MHTRQNTRPTIAQTLFIKLPSELALKVFPDISSIIHEVQSDPTTELTVNHAIAINGSASTKLKTMLERRIASLERFQ